MTDKTTAVHIGDSDLKEGDVVAGPSGDKATITAIAGQIAYLSVPLPLNDKRELPLQKVKA